MRNVLIVAGIRQAFTRIFPLGAYLPEFGWQATILTPEVSPVEMARLGAPSGFVEHARVVHVPFRGDTLQVWRGLLAAAGFRPGESLVEQLKDRTGLIGETSAIDWLLRWYQSIFAYPDAERSWRGPAVRMGDAVIRSGRFEAVMSSSPFPTTHLVAAALKHRHRLYWLADFRDPWTRNHNYPYGRIRLRLEERMERSVLRDSDAITAASPAYARKQEVFHGRTVRAIPVGFDPALVNDPPVALTTAFTLTYTGTIYARKQDPDKVLQAVARLIQDRRLAARDVEVRFYGPRLHWLKRRIAALGLSAVATQHGPVSRTEAIRRQQESQVLLLLNWEDRAERGVYPLKLFEYLAARRPILATGGIEGDDVEHILIGTAAGRYATTPERIAEAIYDFYQEYRNGGTVAYGGMTQRAREYDHREVARQFAGLLSHIPAVG